MSRRLFFDQQLDVTSNVRSDAIYSHLVSEARLLPIRELKPDRKSFGFGPKKNSDHNAGGHTDDANEELDLGIRPNSANVCELFCDWIDRQYELSRTGRYAVHLAFGRIYFHEDLDLPVLWVPVQLLPIPGVQKFGIYYDGGEPFLNPQIHKAGLSHDQLPVLPQMPEELNLIQWFKDFRQELTSHKELQLTAELQFQVASSELATQPNTSLPFGLGVKKKKPPPPTEPDANPLDLVDSKKFIPLKSPGKLTASFITELDTGSDRAGFISGSRSSTQECLINLIAYGIQNHRPVYIVSDDPEPLESVEENLNCLDLQFTTLPFYRIQNRRQWWTWIKSALEITQSIDEKAEFTLPDPPRDAITFLNETEEALSKPFGELNLYPRHIASRLRSQHKHEFKKLPLEEPDKITEEQLERYQELLKQYLSVKLYIGDEQNHPWNWVGATKLSDEEYTELTESWEELIQIIQNLHYYLRRICHRIGFPFPATPSESKSYLEALRLINESPNIDIHQFEINWKSAPEAVKEIFDLLERGENQTEAIKLYFNPEILQENLVDKVPRLYKKSRKMGRYLSWSYQKDVQKFLEYGINDKVQEDGMFWHALHEAMKLQEIQNRLEELKTEGLRYFGKYWKGINSNRRFFDDQISWLQRYQDALDEYPMLDSEDVRKFISERRQFDLREISSIEDLKNRLDEYEDRLTKLLKAGKENPLQNGLNKNWEAFRDDLVSYRNNFEKLNSWLGWQYLNSLPESSTVKTFLEQAHQQGVHRNKLPSNLKQVILYSILETIKDERPVLRKANSETIELNLDKVQQHITSLTSRAPAHIRFLLHEKINRAADSDELREEASRLHEEIQNGSQRLSIPNTLDQTGRILTEYLPVWLLEYSQLEHIANTDTSPLFILLDPPEHLPKISNGAVCAITRKTSENQSADPFRIPQSISFQVVPEDESSKGKIHPESLADVLDNINPENKPSSAVYFNTCGRKALPSICRQILKDKNQLPGCRNILNPPNLKLDQLPPVCHQSKIIVDTTGATTEEAQQMLSGLFYDSTTKTEIRVYCRADQLENGLNQTTLNLGFDPGQSPHKPVLLHTYLNPDNQNHFHILPDPDSPLAALLIKKDDPDQVFALFTHNKQISLWERYAEIHPFVSPKYISPLCLSEELDTELKRIARQLHSHDGKADNPERALDFGFNKK